MIIQNKSNQIQEIHVIDHENPALQYTIYIAAKDSLELSKGLFITDSPEDLTVKKLYILHEGVPVITQKEKHEEDKIEVENDNEDNVVEGNLPSESKGVPAAAITDYLCEFCGKEFASERGLSMHINKAHKE